MEGDRFWFTIRKSGTEDIVKVVGEASDKELFEQERKTQTNYTWLLSSMKNKLCNKQYNF